MTDSKKAEARLLLLEASMSWCPCQCRTRRGVRPGCFSSLRRLRRCMSMPYSKKAEAGLLLHGKAEVMPVNDVLEKGSGRASPLEASMS